MRFETSAGFADWMARFVALGLDQGQWDRGPEEIKLVDVERVAERPEDTSPARPVVIIVGRPEWIGSCAGEFSAIEVYDTAGGQLKYVTSKTGGGR